MLHYKKYAPDIESPADKQRVLREVKNRVKTYEKGYYPATAQIGEKYPEAVKNAKSVLNDLLQEGLPELNDTDIRNRWLYNCSKTFSTVFEAIEYLESLKD